MPKRAEVDLWFESYANPMKPIVQAIREVILAADPRIDECIKWQAPTFTFAGNLASFYPRSKQHASLMFHQGAQIPGEHPRLVGDGDTSRVLKLGSLAEVEAAKPEIEAIVHAWIAWKREAAKPTTASKKQGAAVKKSAAKKSAAKKTAAKKSAAKKR